MKSSMTEKYVMEDKEHLSVKKKVVPQIRRIQLVEDVGYDPLVIDRHDMRSTQHVLRWIEVHVLCYRGYIIVWRFFFFESEVDLIDSSNLNGGESRRRKCETTN